MKSLRLIALLSLLVAVAAIATDGRAQTRPAPFRGTPEELEAYGLYTDNQLLSARTKVEAILRRNPDSIVGNYVLGCVLREAEGSLARAMHYLGRARELYEEQWGINRPSGAPWRLHQAILFEITQLAGEIEQYDYQLNIIEFYDSLYDPDLLAEHAWPLIHLREYDRAREFARRAVATNDPWEASLGLNALCAIEAEAGTRQPQYDACIAALEGARRRSGAPAPAAGAEQAAPTQQITVHAYNAALAALSVMRRSDAERLAKEGAARLEFTTANPWRFLASLYCDEGKAQQAIEALREMQRWRARQPANLRDQDHAETDAVLATTLLVVGEIDSAFEIIERALARPDRRGLSSSNAEQAQGGHALLRRAIRRTETQMRFEHASSGSFFERVGARLSSIFDAWQVWGDEQRVLGSVSNNHRLVETVRMYVRGGIEPVPSWLVADLVEVVGPGVVAVALDRAATEDARFTAVAPYRDALRAEVELSRGDEQQALTLARRALSNLPPDEALLTARVAAIGAEAAWSLGRQSEARSLYSRAMQKDPGVIRRLGLALPATVNNRASGEAATLAGDALARSPRFRDGERGFTVALSGNSSAGVTACLSGPDGSRIQCVDVAKKRGESEEAFGRRIVDEFHDRVFALRVVLSTTDMHSLDGSVAGGLEQSREEMRRSLNALTTE
ncbi:MAG: hypothetical protein IPK60_23875 [Sandaracinaceae bacterium]|jgi:tetratricopeptide (TPR) repeat protein|nr:hypothetical protein [Sandaracinaceae bacterium]